MPYFTTRDGCRLYYEAEGFESARPVIVFLNGTMQSTINWKTHATALKDQYQVLMYDARAQGQSDLGEHELSLGSHAADLGALLAHLGIEKAHLVGLSHGAKVALAYASHSPEHVDRLLLCSVTATLTWRAKLFLTSWLEVLKEAGIEAMTRASLPVVFGESFLKHKEGILDGIAKAIVTRNSKEALVAQLEAMTAYPPLAEIAGHVRNPCLVISASEDPLVTEEGARQLADLCHGQHEHLAGIGHSVPSEAPELFNKTILDFLSKT